MTHFWHHDVFLMSWGVSDVIMNFLALCVTCFWTAWSTFHDMKYFWRHNKLFVAMTCFMTYFWRHGVFLTSWRIFDVMVNFLTPWRTFCRHDKYFDVMKCFWHHDELFGVVTCSWQDVCFISGEWRVDPLLPNLPLTRNYSFVCPWLYQRCTCENYPGNIHFH